MIRCSFYKFVLPTISISISCFISLALSAQPNSKIITDSLSKMRNQNSYYKSQKDIIDITLTILHKNPDSRLDSNGIKVKKVYTSVGPILEYTLSTGFTTGIAASGSFLTSAGDETNTSVVLAAVKYTQKNQFLFPVQSSYWTPSNKYNFLGDW